MRVPVQHNHVGTNITNGEEVAIKLESTSTKHPQLQYESRLYKLFEGGVGIPQIQCTVSGKHALATLARQPLMRLKSRIAPLEKKRAARSPTPRHLTLPM